MSADLQFTVEPTTQAASDDQRATILANPGFGQYFSDHMAIATWTAEKGWHDARITAFGPLELSPATSVFHYAQTIFEGMKAYRHPDDSIHLFRPEANAVRFQRSAHRLALPELPTAAFLDSLHKLADLAPGTSVLPGHGPELPDAAQAARHYLAHREQRLEQVRGALATLGPEATARQVVEVVYVDVDQTLWGAAELSVRAQLDYLRG